MVEAPQRVIVIGASGGIGRALARELLDAFPEVEVHATHNRRDIAFEHPRARWHRLDIRDPGAIEDWSSNFDRVDWVINCAGFLHGEQGGPGKNIRSLEADFMLENIRINTLPTLLLARHLASALKHGAAPILATVSARVGSIEWKHSHPRGCVAALHPGTNDTALSEPFQANVASQNLLTPAYTAGMFVKLLSQLDPAQSGNFWAWDGSRLPW
jgi:nucleoside-diphosphate-sugar epimerase